MNDNAAAARATLLDFARANDAAAATTKKLAKQAVLAEYFRTLTEPDLRLAVRFAAGRTFAATDERVLAVGGAIVSDAVLSLLNVDPGAYYDLTVKSGEIGEALSVLWTQRASTAPSAQTPPPPPTGSPAAPPRDTTEDARPGVSGESSEVISPSPLTLHDLSRAFDQLASTGVREQKHAILFDRFSRCADGREAAYLSKIIFGDMRTGVQEGVLQAAIAQAFDKPLPAVQRCQLLVGDLDEVAVLARNDALDTASFRLFHPIQFMLATPQETADDAAATLDGRAFYAEDKLDGIRAQVHKSGGTGPGAGAEARVAIYTRTMDRADASFPDVVEAVSKLPGEFLLDGEIVPFCDGCVLPFAHIQKRLGRKVLTPKILRENPTVFVAFDVLYRDGELLMDRPLRDRRAALAAMGGTPITPEANTVAADDVPADAACATPAGSPVGSALADRGSGDSAGEARSAEADPTKAMKAASAADCARLLVTRIEEVSTAEQITAAFAAARDRRNEGVMLKDPDSVYSPGRRGKWWLKLKTHLPTFDCVVTAAEYGHGKRRKWLSDYTFAVWDRDPALPDAKLVNIGKAYSGVTDEEIGQLTELFLKLSRAQYGRVHVVEPKIVLEIACDQIQASARHASGYALRFPRIKRIRWDKRPEDADRLGRIVEIYQSTPNFARPVPLPATTDAAEGDGDAPPVPRKSSRAKRKPPAPAEPSLFDGLGG